MRFYKPAQFVLFVAIRLLSVEAFAKFCRHPPTKLAEPNSRKIQNIIAMKSSKKPNENTKSSKDTNTNIAEKVKIKPRTWNPLRLMVLKLGFTEPPGISPWNYQKKEGTFVCAYCGHELFASTAKYDSGSGWPSFWRTKAEGAVAMKREFDGRLECLCQRCNSHLGHVFMDGPRPSDVPIEVLQTAPESDPRGMSDTSRLPRYCINGASLMFKARDEK
jgi:peptide-methionine (R)-S-oxide reductase